VSEAWYKRRMDVVESDYGDISRNRESGVLEARMAPMAAMSLKQKMAVSHASSQAGPMGCSLSRRHGCIRPHRPSGGIDADDERGIDLEIDFLGYLLDASQRNPNRESRAVRA